MPVLPDYRRSVYNVPHTILHNFGVKSGNEVQGFAGGDKTILVLVDAMGSYFLPMIEHSQFSVDSITSTFPSTTAAAVTSIFTGLSPKEHGILEWYMFYECTESIIKTIPFTEMQSDSRDTLTEKCDPRTLFGIETVFDKLARRGIKSSAYIKKDYQNSLYSKFMTHGANSIGFRTEEDIPKLVAKDDADYIYIYIDTVDTVQHRFGPDSEEIKNELRRIWKIVNEIVNNKKDYDIFVTADHGQIEIKNIITVQIPKNCPVGGSPRDAFIYCEYFPEEYKVIGKEKFMRLLGPEDSQNHKNLHLRLPEYVVMPPENTGVWFKEFKAKGLHGGMSRDEMLIPLLHHNR